MRENTQKFGRKTQAKLPATAKKGMLPCCKFLFKQIEVDLAHIQAQNLQNVQKNALLEKSSRSQLVKKDIQVFLDQLAQVWNLTYWILGLSVTKESNMAYN